MFENLAIPAGPSAQRLIEAHAASRVAAADATLYDYSAETVEFSARFMGWASLCTNPPFPPAEIAAFAAEQRAAGLDDVLLIGQGGSTQASMTMAAFLAAAGELGVRFHTMDVLDPAQVRAVLAALDPARSIVIVSSKSGSTIEPTMVFKCVWDDFCTRLGAEAAGKRFVAITDPGSKLEGMAGELGFLRSFPGLPNVGGRFSALSVFGLVPFALMGVDVEALVEECRAVQELCARDDASNPALLLAGFAGDAYEAGRDKLVFHFDSASRVLGMWLEQLIAESLGKDGKGILPGTEPVLELFSCPCGDRSAVSYAFASEPAALPEGIPGIALRIDKATDVAAHFLLWEHAVAMMAYLLGVNAFDQPNVESTKKAVRGILYGGEDAAYAPAAAELAADAVCAAVAGYEVSEALQGAGEAGAVAAVEALLASIAPGDYFMINAFLPADEGSAREALESLRAKVAARTGCVACLEIGPRYLHSIGQFQKGAANNGVFLVLSADAAEDLPIPGEDFALGQLAATQARGDFAALDACGRRAVHLHLAACDPAFLAGLA